MQKGERPLRKVLCLSRDTVYDLEARENLGLQQSYVFRIGKCTVKGDSKKSGSGMGAEKGS